MGGSIRLQHRTTWYSTPTFLGMGYNPYPFVDDFHLVELNATFYRVSRLHWEQLYILFTAESPLPQGVRDDFGSASPRPAAVVTFFPWKHHPRTPGKQWAA